MKIAVQGWRASSSEWDAVRGIPPADLPALTDEQREVARKLGVAEEDYARSVLAGQRTQEFLLQKAEALAKFLENRIANEGRHVRVDRVVLDVVEHRFIVELDVNGKSRILRIGENIVDDYFDSGSMDAEASLARVLDRAFLGVSA
jgi:hypothetical protein